MNRFASGPTATRLLRFTALVAIPLLVLLLSRPWQGAEPPPSPAPTEATASAEQDAPTETGSTDTGEQAEQNPAPPPPNELLVTTTDDAGEGSLRQAILEANALEGPALITFDGEAGPFGEPQTIELASPLPDLSGEITLDGYIPDHLWQAIGVTVSGGQRFRVFTVAPEGRVTLRSLTVADGAAPEGAGILNRGALVVRGLTLMNNAAEGTGGALANLGGTATVINSTFTLNRADTGGGLANLEGRATITNSTFSDNEASRGGGLFSDAALRVANTILANSAGGADCVSTGSLDPASSGNLIEANEGCGTPVSTADPVLESLDYYNGPTQTLPLRGGSPAINLGDNAAAVDENGAPLVWDQRGNGDPRFVAGFTDIGAFEHQAFPDFTVDTPEDVALRACTRAGPADCPLRAAIELANATPEADIVTFDPGVFAEATTVRLNGPLPELTSDLTLDAAGTAGVTLVGSGSGELLRAPPGIDLQLLEVEVE